MAAQRYSRTARHEAGRALYVMHRAVYGPAMSSTELKELPSAVSAVSGMLTSRYTRNAHVSKAQIAAAEKLALDCLVYRKWAGSEQELHRFQGEFLCLAPPRYLRQAALSAVFARTAAMAPALHKPAEDQWVRSCIDLLRLYEYNYLQDHGLDDAVADFAAKAPMSLTNQSKAAVLAELSYASQRQAFRVKSFEPFAGLVAGVTAASARNYENPALIDPLIVDAAHKLAGRVRYKLSGVLPHASSANPEVVFGDDLMRSVKTSLTTQYHSVSKRRSNQEAPRYFRVRAYTKSFLYSCLLLPSLGPSRGILPEAAAELARIINRNDGCRLTRHAMWRVLNPLKATFWPMPPELALQPAFRYSDTADITLHDMHRHVRDGESLSPRLARVYGQRKDSRFAAFSPPVH